MEQIEFGSGINYYSDDGRKITKEEFEKEYAIFEHKVDEVYNIKSSEILSRINNIANSDIEKLWMVFDYLTSENMMYNLQGKTTNGRMALDYGYEFTNYKTWKIGQKTKYPALLNNSGVCITYSLAFEDLANKLGIPCRVVDGFTGMEHAWNIVLINNEIKHIDVSLAIMNRQIKNKKDFFLKPIEALGNRTINSPILELEKEMREQYAKLHPQINIISRSDESSINIISRSDVEVPKITIYKK